MDQRADGRSWVMLAGLWLIATGAAAYEIVPASVAPPLRVAMGIGPAAAGAIVSVMFGVAVLGSVPLGVVVDRVDLRRAMVAAAAGLVVAGGWGVLAVRAGDYPSLIASRVLGGAAFVAVWNAGAAEVGRVFDAGTRGTAVAAFTASGPAGFGLGHFTGPIIAERLGPAWTLGAYGVLAVVGITVYWLASDGVASGGGGTPPGVADFRRVLADRRVWHVSALGFLAYALYLFVNSWMPTYLTEGLGVSLAASGALTGVFAAVGVLSRVSGGGISDRVFGARRRPVVVLSFAASVPFVAALGLVESVPVLVVALLGAGFFVQFTIGLALAYARELVEPRVAATAIAVTTSIALSGAFLSPLVTAAVVDATGGFTAAFGLAVGLAVAGTGLALVAPELE